LEVEFFARALGPGKMFQPPTTSVGRYVLVHEIEATPKAD
jgi:hypothetical protein